MSNYPPGVSGNELEIAGPDFEEEWIEVCLECWHDSVLYWGYSGRYYLKCEHCQFEVELDSIGTIIDASDRAMDRQEEQQEIQDYNDRLDYEDASR